MQAELDQALKRKVDHQEMLSNIGETRGEETLQIWR
jgi:hypothetical protein